MLVAAGIAPHPPIIIPEIGGLKLKQVQKTVAGLHQLGKLFKEAGPTLLVVITPHGASASQGPVVPAVPKLSGNFGRFGYPKVELTFEIDRLLLELLAEEVTKETVTSAGSISAVRSQPEGAALDHGALVPLFYLQRAGIKGPGLLISPGLRSRRELFSYGQALGRAIEKRGQPTAVLASGDLSHRLLPGAPAGYSPRGAEFDRQLVELLEAGLVEEIIGLDPDLVAEAGECGLGPVVMVLGVIGDRSINTEIISYEGPFGVGYLVANLAWINKERPESRERALPISDGKGFSLDPPALARYSLEQFFATGGMPALPRVLEPRYKARAGAFVTLKKEDGSLRGCIGTIEPSKGTLAEEIAANALGAAFRDGRFPPLEAGELPGIRVSVDIIGELEPVAEKEQLDPRTYGVFVRSDRSTGVLLPGLAGIETPGQQLEIARRKAGLEVNEPVELYRFRVERFEEA